MSEKEYHSILGHKADIGLAEKKMNPMNPTKESDYLQGSGFICACDHVRLIG